MLAGVGGGLVVTALVVVLTLRPASGVIGTPGTPPEVVPTPATVTVTVAPTRTPVPRATQTPTVDTADPEAEALELLAERAATDGAAIAKRGQWFAQLASKYVGVSDPRQVTASGSHTFGAADIWAELVDLEARVPGGLFLLDSRTYGKRSNRNGEALWVVGAQSPEFVDEASVIAWCQRLYPNLSGKDLTNSCMPNRLNP